MKRELFAIAFLLLITIGTMSFAQPVNIQVDQIGENSSLTVTQDYDSHIFSILTGSVTNSDNNTISVTQQDIVPKTTMITLAGGTYNNITVNQSGSGSHVANIQNLNGSFNGIQLNQSGAGSHTFTVENQNGSTNNGNNIIATQSGGLNANKSFQLLLNGATGSTVNIQQSNPTVPDSSSMTINCTVGCGGTYSYVKY